MASSIYGADCADVLRSMLARGERVHAVVTDPPYGLSFMGKHWDHGLPDPAVWRLLFDLLPPGGHLAAFGGTRTFHRLACNIEDAGFEMRDTLMWLYGTGFPKSHDVSKGIDKMLGAEREVVGANPNHRAVSGVGYEGVYAGGNTGSAVITAAGSPEAAEWTGWGTALKPAWEPIILARKPLAGTVAANVLAHGVGAINVDGCRVGTDGGTRWVSAGDKGDEGQFGGGIKDGAVADAGKGRWPANVLHDGSAEVEAAFAAFGESKSARSQKPAEDYRPNYGNAVFGKGMGGGYHSGFADAGSPSRFFYSAKASAADRAGSKHPTVKPVALMRWLARLVCPPGGVVLDPFAGSGTTGAAAAAEGMRYVLIERDADYLADIYRRLGVPSLEEMLR